MKNSPVEHYSDEGWAACQSCGELIDAERWNELIDRALAVFVFRHQPPMTELRTIREQIERLHKAFRRHRVREC